VKLSEELEKWRIDRPNEWKMDEFMRNAEKLESERDAAITQNLEQLNNCLAALQIANKRIDELEKYNLDLANESHNKSNMIDYERGKNAELVAQVDDLQDAAISVCMRLDGDGVSTSGIADDIEKLQEVVNKTPTQHLRDHDAEVGRAGFIAGFEKCIKDHNIVFIASNYIGHSENYAEKVRRGE
jgi:predicted  nucleic acid-binding Zn-ribbon protein